MDWRTLRHDGGTTNTYSLYIRGQAFAVANLDPPPDDGNRRPIIDPIEDFGIATDIAITQVTGEEPDPVLEPPATAAERFAADSTITISATKLATELQQQVFDLRLYNAGSLYENYYNGGEKWLLSAADGQWYFILPTGDLFRYTGAGLNGTLVGSLDPAAHLDPVGEIASATVPAEIPDPQFADFSFASSVSEHTVTITRLTGSGRVGVLVTATDSGGLADTEQYTIAFGSQGPLSPPVIDPIEDARTSGDAVTTVITGEDPDDSFADTTLTVDVSVSDDLQQLVFDLELYAPAANLYENFYGGGEKWLVSAADGKWYFILPDGQLWQWDGGGGLSGTLWATLSLPAYQDPVATIVDAATPTDIPGANGSLQVTHEVDGHDVTITRLSGSGVATVHVTATDDDHLIGTATYKVEFTGEVTTTDLDLAGIVDTQK